MDINEYCIEMKNDGIILFFDFEKVFDFFEWYYFFYNVFKKMNFGDNFINCDKILCIN